MVDEAGAYAALELPLGAGWDEVERAYKRLIRAHHPDRNDGNSSRAAEITQAYRELRRARERKDDLELADDWPEFPSSKYRWLWAVPGFLILAGVLVLANSSWGTKLTAAGEVTPHAKSSAPAEDVMDAPLAAGAIDVSIREAWRMKTTRDEMALASASRDCHHQLRTSPSIEQLDRCAAFDDAVVQLQDRDPLRDQGPFSEIAVTSRQLSAAQTLSDDSLAIDGRLDRIRLRVELALAPATAPAN
jgi:hypothetical protein